MKPEERLQHTKNILHIFIRTCIIYCSTFSCCICLFPRFSFLLRAAVGIYVSGRFFSTSVERSTLEVRGLGST